MPQAQPELKKVRNFHSVISSMSKNQGQEQYWTAGWRDKKGIHHDAGYQKSRSKKSLPSPFGKSPLPDSKSPSNISVSRAHR
jgi:hypothetical protein